MPPGIGRGITEESMAETTKISSRSSEGRGSDDPLPNSRNVAWRRLIHSYFDVETEMDASLSETTD